MKAAGRVRLAMNDSFRTLRGRAPGGSGLDLLRRSEGAVRTGGVSAPLERGRLHWSGAVQSMLARDAPDAEWLLPGLDAHELGLAVPGPTMAIHQVLAIGLGMVV